VTTAHSVHSAVGQDTSTSYRPMHTSSSDAITYANAPPGRHSIYVASASCSTSPRRSTTPGACNCASVPADRGANRMHACESCWEGVHVQAATCPVNTNDSCLATMCVSIALRPLPARLPIIMADVRPSDPCDPGLRSLSYIHSYSISPPFRSAIGVVRPVKDNKIEIDV
jgi:hypothetical protein